MSSPLPCENSENACVVCFKTVSIYSIGECDHPVCYECSTRMRVLCRQNECPICRQDMPKVIFIKDVQPYRSIKNCSYLMDKKFKICFDSAAIQVAYSKLLEHVCGICSGRPAFRTFQNLKDHMRKEHELHYCDLCVDNLKIFTGERRCYTRQELAQHRRKGDPDDTSHRGHPLCEFCDQRYMDNDELYRHLRRDHLFCHFCDADGFHQYYSSYDYLRDHFRADHFLCEEGNCLEEKFTSAFRSEIDLKAHRASVHGRMMGKAAAKQARTLELEFTLAPRPRERNDGRRGPPPLRSRGHDEETEILGAVGGENYDNVNAETPLTLHHHSPHLNTNCIEEFPTLSGAGTLPGPSLRTNSRHVAVNNGGGLTIRTVRQPPLAVTDENFPALGADLGGSGGYKTVRLSVNSSSQETGSGSVRGGSAKNPTNVSIHLNHRPNGAVTTRLSSSQNIHFRPNSIPSRSESDFPSLSGSKSSTPLAAQWLGSQGHAGAKAKVQPASQKTQFVKKALTVEEFPTLSSKSGMKNNSNTASSTVNPKSDNRSKKASSVLIPVSSSWSSTSGSTNSNKVQNSSIEKCTMSSKSNNSEIFTNAANSVANIKVKSKKKKPKNTSAGNTNTSESIPNTKFTNTNNIKESCSGDIGKRKKTQGTLEADEEQNREQVDQNVRNSGTNQEQEIAKKLENILRSSDNNNTGVERKRSELLIESLNSDEEGNEVAVSPVFSNKSVDNNFPEIGSSGTRPPGFSDGVAGSVPPPGFGNTSGRSGAPPPGFCVTLNSVARPQPNGLTFTSSSGESYSILPSRSANTYHFVPPRDSDHRNQALVEKVKASVVDMDEFLQFSALFRQGSLTAHCFYMHCLQTMGTDTFAEIFPEMLVLLPDIDKQQDLWSVHLASIKDSTDSRKPSLDVCATCNQVLSPSDLRHHQSSHTLENHFSGLPSTKTSVQAWNKNKNVHN